jgi:hypothetical protein
MVTPGFSPSPYSMRSFAVGFGAKAAPGDVSTMNQLARNSFSGFPIIDVPSQHCYAYYQTRTTQASAESASDTRTGSTAQDELFWFKKVKAYNPKGTFIFNRDNYSASTLDVDEGGNRGTLVWLHRTA